MVAEVLGAFAPVPAGLIFDGTVGGGGHAGALLEANRDSVVLGLDRDAERWMQREQEGEQVISAAEGIPDFGI